MVLYGIDLPSESSQISINVEYINPPEEGMNVCETELSTILYTSEIDLENRFFSNSAYWKRGLFSKTSGGYKKVDLNSVMYQDGTVISGDAIDEDSSDEDGAEGESSWFEKMITWFGLSLAEGIRIVLNSVLDTKDISIDKFVFNEYEKTRLSIFSSIEQEKGNTYLEASGIVDNAGTEGTLTKYFNFFRGIAIAAYLVMLLATGVMILLKSTAKDKEKYKSMLVDWVKGVLIIAFFPYVMKYAILINSGIVQYFSDLRETIGAAADIDMSMPSLSDVGVEEAQRLGLVDSDKLKSSDMMEYMRLKAWEEGRLAYFIVYVFLLKELIGFIYIYFKRLLTVIFLIFVFPLVTVSYAFDKVGNGKADAFGHWFNEFFLNVFLQSFQAANYIIVMPVIFILASENSTINAILLIIGITYISKGDILLKSMFSKMSGGGAGTTKNLSEAVSTMLKLDVATSVAKQAGSIGKRFGQLKGNINAMQHRYYDLQDAKKQERLDNYWKKQETDENSVLNREERAVDDVDRNMQIALSDLRTPEERKLALDRLEIAKNDPNRRAKFEEAMNKLNSTTTVIDPKTGQPIQMLESEKLEKLMIANNAINESIIEGAKGSLVSREVNINANIVYDVLSGGSTGLYAGLYNWAESKHVKDSNGNLVSDGAGNNMSVASYLDHLVEERRLSDHEKEQFEKVQKFTGNVTGLDTRSIGTERVAETTHGPLEVKEYSSKERARSRRIMDKYGNNAATAESKQKQERAANLVARMQSYKFMVDNGKSNGMSATEAKNLAAEWRNLQNDADEDVQKILRQLGDASITGEKMEANVGFTLEQFETMSSLAVLSDTENLVGTDDEKQEMINSSIEHLVKVSKGEAGDKVSQIMIQRAEIDSVIQDFYDEENVDASNYIRTNQSQEELRDIREYNRVKKELEDEYDRNKARISVAQARGNLIRSATRTVGSALSVGAIPLNVSAAIAGASLYAGASGNTDDMLGYTAATAAGMGVENAVESFVPGTIAADKNRRSVGGAVDAYADRKINSNLSYSNIEVNEDFARQQRINNSARERIKKYQKYTD